MIYEYSRETLEIISLSSFFSSFPFPLPPSLPPSAQPISLSPSVFFSYLFVSHVWFYPKSLGYLTSGSYSSRQYQGLSHSYSMGRKSEQVIAWPLSQFVHSLLFGTPCGQVKLYIKVFMAWLVSQSLYWKSYVTTVDFQSRFHILCFSESLVQSSL